MKIEFTVLANDPPEPLEIQIDTDSNQLTVRLPVVEERIDKYQWRFQLTPVEAA